MALQRRSRSCSYQPFSGDPWCSFLDKLSGDRIKQVMEHIWKLQEFCNSMAKLDIDGYEYAYLKAIVLFSPGKICGGDSTTVFHLCLRIFLNMNLLYVTECSPNRCALLANINTCILLNCCLYSPKDICHGAWWLRMLKRFILYPNLNYWLNKTWAYKIEYTTIQYPFFFFFN